MKNLESHQAYEIAGGVGVKHVEGNTIITIAMNELFSFNGFNFTWAPPQGLQQGGLTNGYYVTYSMGTDTIATYTLKPAGKK